MTLRETLHKASKLLEDSSTTTPWLDAVVLYGLCSGQSKEFIYAHYPDPIDNQILKKYNALIADRKKGIPVAYLVGHKEFFGIDFLVDPRVLIPRPDTEILVETAEEIIKKSTSSEPILDLCSGSGCVGISLKTLFPPKKIVLSDISPKAIEVIKLNIEKTAREVDPAISSIEVYHSDLMESVPGSFSVIVSNPPYLTPRETQQKIEEGWIEPSSALDGGSQGLYIISRLVNQAAEKLVPKGWLLLEAAPEQMEQIQDLLLKHGFSEIFTRKDLAGHKRVIIGRR